MSLYRDGVYQIGLIRCGVQSLYCLADQNVVSRPASQRSIFLNVHTFLTGKGVKAHHGKSIGTAVEVATVIVYYMGAVSDGVQVGCDALAVCFL